MVQDEIVVPINMETTWMKDLSALLRSHGMRDNIYLLLQVFIIPIKPGNIGTSSGINSSQYETLGYTVLQINNNNDS